MGEVRSRFQVNSRIWKGTCGRSTWHFDDSGGYELDRSRELCVDISPSAGGGPLTVVRDDFSGGVINMPFTSYHQGYFNQYTCDYLTLGSWRQFHIGTDSPDDVDVATKVTAATNPSRPWVDMVTSIAQLPSSVSAIKERFRQFYGLGKVAQTYLKYKFDVLPNVTDLLKILLFQEKVDDRLKEMTRLRERGLRRTIQIGTYENRSSEDYPVQSVDRLIYVPLTYHTTERVWGYITWTPDSVFPTDSDEMRRLAVAATYGITIDASTAWELIPWSWLVDWCSNFGTYFEATRNIIPAVPSPVQVMRHRTTTVSSPAYQRDDMPLSMSAIHATSERKTRKLVSPSLTAHMPLLTGEHASILASIGVLSGGDPGSGRRFRSR